MKRVDHKFGSDWTQDKLNRLKRYLVEYVKIMKKNERAQFFKIIYVDAFAGTGYIKLKSEETQDALEGFLEPGVQDYINGSASIALDTQPFFDEFVFIEKKGTHVEQLHLLKDDFPDLAKRIKIVKADANDYLIEWCRAFPKRTQRAVVFLDPYGMQVEWRLLEEVAATQSVDLWLLFPISAVRRMLPKSAQIPDNWKKRLDSFFGTREWEKEFYKTSEALDLFSSEPSYEVDAEFAHIGKYYVNRLKTLFPYVSPNPHILKTERGIPLYMLCFAASNPKGGPIALGIANHILRM